MTNKLEVTLFGATSTTDEVLSGVNLKGKRGLVTGVSAGLGVETARSLVAHGSQVVGAARDLNKAKVATEQVRKDAAANRAAMRTGRAMPRMNLHIAERVAEAARQTAILVPCPAPS